MAGNVEMIFEIGFNFCCRNFFSNSSFSVDNLSLKLSCNLLNEITNITENCLVEFFGEWARVMSFLEPGMDMKIVAALPTESNSSWNDSVVIRNLSCPEPVEVRYVISKISVVETKTDRPNRLIEFGSNRKILNCRVSGGAAAGNSLSFPNYWMDHKRKAVEHNASAFRPLTTVTADVAVINVLVAFISNSPPGPYKVTGSQENYVRAHVQVCDMSFENLRLAAIRTGGDDLKEVPCFHLHLQIDEDVSASALPWLCVGDVLQVNTVKPVFAQKQAWNLYHKQKKFGNTQILIHSIQDGKVRDVRGNVVADSAKAEAVPGVKELKQWIRNRLEKDTLISANHVGQLSGRNEWFTGRDLVVRIESVNTYTNAISVTDFSIDEPVEVLIRTTQQNFADSLNYFFTRFVEKESGMYVLLRNVRVVNDTLLCSLEHVTMVPDFCFDVQELKSRKNKERTEAFEEIMGTRKADRVEEGKEENDEWERALKSSRQSVGNVADSACVDASSQITFEFLDEDENSQSNCSQNIATKSSLDSPRDTKRVKYGN